uniref:hypothetical protein n=1 Tax=Orrella sp. TaxID=1921583 RepID=UPI00405537AC
MGLVEALTAMCVIASSLRNHGMIANGFLDVHSHPFEARALILCGEIETGLGDTKQTYWAGEVFT